MRLSGVFLISLNYVNLIRKKIANFPNSITEIQNNYFLAPSFAEMKKLVIKYAENIKKPFNLTYNADDRCIEIDRRITTRREYV